MLVISAPVFAPPPSTSVLVYNWKEKYTEYELEDSGWYLWRGGLKGYITLEISGDSAYAVFIETYKEKIGGKTYKLMDAWSEDFDIVTAQNGKKTLLIASAGDDEYRVLLTGLLKSTKIGDTQVDIATKLDGDLIWNEPDDPNNRDLGISKESARLNKKMTNFANEEGYDADDAADWIVDELIRQGYEWD